MWWNVEQREVVASLALLPQPQQPGAQERATRQIKRPAGFRRGDGEGGSVRIGSGHILRRQRQPELRRDHLSGVAVFRDEAGAEDVMPADDFVQRVFERLNVDATGEVKGKGDIVEGTVGFELAQNPHALLGKRQRPRSAVRA